MAKIISEKFLSKKFFLGDISGLKGWDCLNSLAGFYDSMDCSFPHQFKDWDESNYPERWKKNEENCREVLKEFLLTLGDPIDPQYRIMGDLLLFEGRSIPLFPAIFIGNGNVMLIFKNGVKIAPLNHLSKWLVGARRLIK